MNTQELVDTARNRNRAARWGEYNAAMQYRRPSHNSRNLRPSKERGIRRQLKK